jgi:folate-binding protein YgfZ
MSDSLQPLFAAAGAVYDAGNLAEPLHFGDARGEYDALTAAVGVVDFSRRTQIELAGADRQTFLHNLCTNEVKRLVVGSGCEAFLCNAQGHTLALVNIFCGPETLVVETVPGEEAKLLAHLDRYLIREKVELRGRSDDWAELLLAGPGAAELLQKDSIAPPAKLFDHIVGTIAGVDVALRRVDITQPGGYLISCVRSAVGSVWKSLADAGARPCGAESLEMARIEAGTPEFGRDLSDANLPQELSRDARAISFTKGCYIGQETVARLDALGHVNRTLCGVRFAAGEIPLVGTEFHGEAGKALGQVTSAAFSPRLGAPLALAYVRRGSNNAGALLESSLGSAEVVTLPIAAS